jgi:hypothetical protein
MNTSGPRMLLASHMSCCAFKPVWGSTSSVDEHDKIVKISFLCNPEYDVKWHFTPILHEHHLTLHTFLWHCGPTRVRSSSFVGFLDHTQHHNAVGRTPRDEWSARRPAHYLTTHNTHYRHTSMPPAGFEPKISAGERPRPTPDSVRPLGLTKNTT